MLRSHDTDWVGKGRSFLLILALLFVVAFLVWLFTHRSQNKIMQPELDALLATNSQSQSRKTAPKFPYKQLAVPDSEPANPDSLQEFYAKTKADPQYEWKRPINFYGRVVDVNTAAVSDASIHFTWNDTSEKGTSDADTTSDSNGSFSLTNRRGKAMIVSVSKAGYYGRSGSYEFADPSNGLFIPDPNSPVIFHLRKKGVGADLIISQSGMSTFIRIAPPTNGTPVFVDFFNQKIGDIGQLKMEGWKERKNFKTAQNNWGFRLTVPDGGLIEQSDEFPFEAPEIGYQSTLEWHFKDGDAAWQGGIKDKFYIKFGNPARYGKITVDTSAFTPTVYLEYVINPDGYRNLEPK